jgi:hypothetical protein
VLPQGKNQRISEHPTEYLRSKGTEDLARFDRGGCLPMILLHERSAKPQRTVNALRSL